MKKAIQIAYNDLFEAKCEYASKAGFRYIATNFTEALGKSEDEWKVIAEHIQGILEKWKLESIQTHLYYYDLRLSSEIVEEEREYDIKQSILASGRIGAQWCVLHPRTSITSGYRAAQSLADNRKAIDSYLEYAMKANTGIAVENLPIFRGIVPVMPFYSSNYDDLCELVDCFADDRVKACWDTGHANMMDFNQAEAILYMGERIKCTHIHNNFKHSDDHLTPDQGNIAWDKVMKAFQQIGYDGPLTLETHCCYPEEELLQSFAKHNLACLEYLEKMMQ